MRYSAALRWLHWAVAGLIVTQFVLAELAERAEQAGAKLQTLALLANHKSVGITILVLAVVRLSARLASPVPALPAEMPAWQVTASRVSHLLLYSLILVLPVTGWLMSSATAYPVSWFGLLTLPDLVAANPVLADRLETVHQWLATLLLVVAAVHVAAALKHAFIDRDGVLSRMATVPTVAFAVLLAATAVFELGKPAGKLSAEVAVVTPTVPLPAPPAAAGRSERNVTPTRRDGGADEGQAVAAAEPRTGVAAAEGPAQGDGRSGPPPDETDPVGEGVEPAEGTGGDVDPGADPGEPTPSRPLPLWVIDHEASHIRFVAEQAGADFDGHWRDWTGDLRFSASRLNESRFDVAVTVESVDTSDDERDATLLESAWFNAGKYPLARYRAEQFRSDGKGGFVAEGELIVKGNATPVPLSFEVVEQGAKRTLSGTARVDRLAAEIGTGEWSDTEWVGRYVDVIVRVSALVESN